MVSSIRERSRNGSKPSYSVLFRLDKKQSSRTFADRHAAQKFADLIDLVGIRKALQMQDDDEPDDGITVDELAEKYFAWKAGDVTARTMADYRRDYDNWIAGPLGGRPCSSIDERDVQAWVDKIARDLSAKSVADRHMLLHSMFKYGTAKTRRLVDYNPCTETELPARGKRVVKGATLPEYHALLAAARTVDPDAADLLEFIGGTGWRWSEAAALPVRNVETWTDTDGRTTTRATVGQVWRKDGAGLQVLAEDEAKSQAGLRTVKLPASVAAVVERRIVGKQPGDLVFTNAAGRKWYQQNFLTRTWRRIEDKAGLDRHLTPHAIRHTHVGLLNRSGASLAEMQRRVGHEDIQTTINVYGGMIDDISDEVLDRLDSILTGGDPALGGQIVAGEIVEDALGELV